MEITVNQTFILDSSLELAEKFFRAYHKAHPDLHLELPCNENVINQINKTIEESIATSEPILSDSIMFRLTNPLLSFFLSDCLLDDYETDILATVHANYAPAFFHEHAFFELIYVAQGSCINYCGNRELKLNTGDFLILAPGTRHAISAFADSCRIVNTIIRVVCFEQTFFKAFSKQDILYSFFFNVLYRYETNTYILFHTGEDHFLCSNILNLLESSVDKWTHREEFKKSLVSFIFYYLLNHYEHNTEIFTDANTEKQYEITLMLQYMQNHYADLTLSDFSHAFGYSSRQMNRILLAYTQKSFQHNLQDIRMHLAKLWLENGTLSVEAIAERLGYSTVSNFRKIFKKYYQVSPKQYQMQRRT